MLLIFNFPLDPMSEKHQTSTDETFAPLIGVAILLVLDIAFSNTSALPGQNHLEPLDSMLKALVMLTLALVAYIRPVEYGAQLLERGLVVAGLGWLITILGSPFAVLALVDRPVPQLGLLTTVICAIIANIATYILVPRGGN